jgi:chemotaxis protein MotB
MKAFALPRRLWALGLWPLFSGCLFVPRTQFLDLQTQNRALAEQNRAQLAEIENLRVHSRNIEDKIGRSEEGLAVLEERLGLDKTELGNYQRERAILHDQVQDLMGDGLQSRLPRKTTNRLMELSRRYPSLRFDPATGIAKLDTDILFDSGEIELKPGARELAGELVRALKSPEADDLKVMIVGHTDDNYPSMKNPARGNQANDFPLSAARALAVADLMRQAGLPEQRLGVAGMGSHEPVAAHDSAQDRQKNRRVEIFVMASDVPVVGWTDSLPTLY